MRDGLDDGMSRLMQAIILQAIQDAKSASKKSGVGRRRAEALLFIETPGMFEEISELAGWNPDDLRRRFRIFREYPPMPRNLSLGGGAAGCRGSCRVHAASMG